MRSEAEVIFFSTVIPGEPFFFYVIPGERSETRNPETTLIHAAVVCVFLDSGSVLRTVRNDRYPPSSRATPAEAPGETRDLAKVADAA